MRFLVHQVQHYILVVQATDGGVPALSSTVTVYCNVVDLNDNAPIFEAGPHAADIKENITVGSPVLTVTAQDLDSGDNGRVVYAVAGGDDDGDFGMAANGTLFTQRPLDRERKPLYNLVLSATDSPLPPAHPLSSTVQVSFEYFRKLLVTKFRVCERRSRDFRLLATVVVPTYAQQQREKQLRRKNNNIEKCILHSNKRYLL